MGVTLPPAPRGHWAMSEDIGLSQVGRTCHPHLLGRNRGCHMAYSAQDSTSASPPPQEGIGQPNTSTAPTLRNPALTSVRPMASATS